MAWDFSTEPEFEAKLAWMRDFVREANRGTQISFVETEEELDERLAELS